MRPIVIRETHDKTVRVGRPDGVSGRTPLAEADRAVHRAAEVVHGRVEVRPFLSSGGGGDPPTSPPNIQASPLLV